MCFYWKMVIDLEAQICIFLRSIRKGNPSLYVQLLRSLVKWFLPFNHHNYSRLINTHVFDLISLLIIHPDVYHQITQGSFTFGKSELSFPRMALDQVHEQNNKIIKGQGGESELSNLEDESVLIRWEICGPEVWGILCQFEKEMKDDDPSFHTTSTKNNKDNMHFRLNFRKNVQTVLSAFPAIHSSLIFFAP